MRSDPTRTQGERVTDTPETVLQQQSAILRSLSTVEVAAIINGATRATRLLALAGIRSRHPDASDDELVARLAQLTLEPDLARRAYPVLATLDDSSGL
jgi:hypothetical protein